MTAEELPNEYDSLPERLTGERVLAHLAALTTPRRTGAEAVWRRLHDLLSPLPDRC